jgi:hypothetical protein
MTLCQAILRATECAREEDFNQVVGSNNGKWFVTHAENSYLISEMEEPKFIVTKDGVAPGHIERGEITANWELPADGES